MSKSNRRWPPIVTMLVIAVAGLVAGCGGGGTGPDPGEPPTISFTPTAQGQTIDVGQTRRFTASVTPAGALVVDWLLDGATVATGSAYDYVAAVVGRDTLRVHADAGTATRDFFWVLDVMPEAATAPPAVPNPAIAAGDAPVSVVLSWSRVTGSTYPIVDYLVVLSYAGPVTAANWPQAQVLSTVPHVAGQSTYTAEYDRDQDGLLPGTDAWFALRARDDHGQLSTQVVNRFTRISTEWWIDGLVLDDEGRPLLGVIVGTSSPLRNDNTDGDGIFRLGPYRSVDTLTVRTTSVGYYDFSTPRLVSETDANVRLVLPERHGVDAHCTSYGGDFLTYFRHMTRTRSVAGDTAAARLWKWDHWPLSIFLPDSALTSGRQLDDLARPMVALWNEALGGIYLVETGAAAGADIVAGWVTDASAGYGETLLVFPTGAQLGDVIPQRVRVEVETGLLTDQFFQEVMLHELGHALGLVEHSLDCTGAGHLMVFGASGNLSLPDPIHPDEVRAVRALRNLSQGVDMTRFEP